MTDLAQKIELDDEQVAICVYACQASLEGGANLLQLARLSRLCQIFDYDSLASRDAKVEDAKRKRPYSLPPAAIAWIQDALRKCAWTPKHPGEATAIVRTAEALGVAPELDEWRQPLREMEIPLDEEEQAA